MRTQGIVANALDEIGVAADSLGDMKMRFVDEKGVKATLTKSVSMSRLRLARELRLTARHLPGARRGSELKAQGSRVGEAVQACVTRFYPYLGGETV